MNEEQTKDLVRKTIEGDQEAVEYYKDGNFNVIQFFVIKVMKLSNDEADPKVVFDNVLSVLSAIKDFRGEMGPEEDDELKACCNICKKFYDWNLENVCTKCSADICPSCCVDEGTDCFCSRCK